MLDDWAPRPACACCRTGCARARAGVVVLTTVLQLLYREMGFRGNVADYYDPRNSFLNLVLERRTGIPITLAWC